MYRRSRTGVKKKRTAGRAGGPFAAVLAVVAAAMGCAAGCADRAPQVARQQLFSLPAGPLEDQVQIAPGYEQGGVRLYLSGGLFHVVNVPARKVMRFSPFGDLLLLLYHPRFNPAPVGLAEAAPDTVSTRRARSLSLGPPGHVAADSHGTIYVQERLVPDAWETDDPVTRSHVVRRFDRTGGDRGYLGREGVSGTPFGFVQRLAVTERDEVLVVTRDAETWQAYWFDAQGLLQFRRRLADADLGGADGPAAVEIVAVVADPIGSPRLLVEAASRPDGHSAIWRVSGDAAPVRVFAAPRSQHAPFRLLGSGGGRLFFVAHAGPNRVLLAITGRQGRSLAQIELSLQDAAPQLAELQPSRFQFSELQVAVDGILYGARIGPEHVEFFWWRTDLLMQRR